MFNGFKQFLSVQLPVGVSAMQVDLATTLRKGGLVCTGKSVVIHVSLFVFEAPILVAPIQ